MNDPELLELVKDLALHVKYMHGLLAEGQRHYGELEDYHWHRWSVELLARSRAVLQPTPVNRLES